MTENAALQKLQHNWGQKKFLCVGLDPDFSRIPENVMRDYVHAEDTNSPAWRQQMAAVYLGFCKIIAELTTGVAAAYKPNLQFFIGLGGYGVSALEELCQSIRTIAPQAVLILDGKWGDIGDTNKQAARFAFDICQADAVTLNPLPGKEKGLQAFFNYPDKLFFILAAMSHPGATEFGSLRLKDDRTDLRLSEYIAQVAGGEWQQGLVVGATRPEVVSAFREIAPDAPLLIPGVGKQGGDLARAARSARDNHGQGFLINVSSAICYPTVEKGESYVDAVQEAASDYSLQIVDALQGAT